MTKNKRAAALLGLVLAGTAAAAPPLPTPGAVSPTNFAERLRARYPGTEFGAIAGTVWPGVFEVEMGENLAYVDSSGRYFLFGHLYDMQAQRDLTAERDAERRRIAFSRLPLADAFPEIRGKGERRLAVFSDPDCPYCRQLETSLQGLDNVKIYRFLLPLAALHPEARAKAISVWCAPDPLKAWQGLLRGDAPPPTEIKIYGTPTLVLGDGRILPGVATLPELERWLGAPGQAGSANREANAR